MGLGGDMNDSLGFDATRVAIVLVEATEATGAENGSTGPDERTERAVAAGTSRNPFDFEERHGAAR